MLGQQQEGWRQPEPSHDAQQQKQSHQVQPGLDDVKSEAEDPADYAAPSQIVTNPSPPWAEFHDLRPDLQLQARVSTGYTQVDWSGLSFEENGRHYQGYMPDAYILPNDGEEQDRLDFQHTLTDIILGGQQYLAPIQSPCYVLDIGAGTGIWCIEFAEQHQESFVFGTDLCLIQAHPRTNNCTFVLENSETAEWSFPCPLDYVHLRSVGPCFDDIRVVLRKSFDAMAPGGWIELEDGDWIPKSIDGSLEGTALQRWFHLAVIGGQRLGRDLLKVHKFKEDLIEAGFVGVEQQVFQVPGSAWARGARAKRLGHYTTTVFLQIVDSYHKFLSAAGLSDKEISELIPAVKRDLLDLRIHWYLDAYFVYGQKPQVGEGEYLSPIPEPKYPTPWG
ncbi:S-adenosyl-L-methionine-dependent methyltransferase [Xylariales sp. PMI_506]|nr:S-adenosyl-L-methionine-dependent methyltransferase [Xylariales sp. PMI_506]